METYDGDIIVEAYEGARLKRFTRARRVDHHIYFHESGRKIIVRGGWRQLQRYGHIKQLSWALWLSRTYRKEEGHVRPA